MTPLDTLVSRETLAILTTYVDTLLHWQKRINLISNQTIDHVWTRHILDAVQLKNHIPQNKTILDIGTGAGIPGLILSICGHDTITLVESDQRKVAFLREASRLCNVTPTIICNRVENITLQPFDYVISRACASITQLITYSHIFLHPNSVCLFPKGENYTKEILEAEKMWSFDYETFKSLSDTSGNIIKLYNITKR